MKKKAISVQYYRISFNDFSFYSTRRKKTDDFTIKSWKKSLKMNDVFNSIL